MALLIFTLAILVGFVVAGSIFYLLFLLITAAFAKRASQRQASYALDTPSGLPQISVLIPAHDEELVLAGTLESLSAQDYPQDRFQVFVIADNCTDSTPQIAQQQGATVLERHNLQQRGKGYALDWALTQLLSSPNPADAYVIVDADTWVAPDFLRLMAHRLRTQSDSRGFCALQGRYGVLNADEGWRAALMAGAFDLFNHIKPLGRDRLGLGVGLKGNGMAFTRALLETAHWRGDSVTEDIDYGLDLARHHAMRVCYAPEALVLAQMPTTAEQAASQRDRWEGGRYKLLRERALPLMREGLRRRNAILCDAAVDLMLPPLAELAGLLVLWALIVWTGVSMHWLQFPKFWVGLVSVSALGLVFYILMGFWIADAPKAAYTALLRAPAYAVWKFCLYAMKPFRKRMSGQKADSTEEWVRTARTPLSKTPAPQTSTVPVEGQPE